MEERKVVLKLDHETKRIICRLLNQHVEAIREKAEGQKTFAKLLLAHEADRTNYILDQIHEQWKQALPSLPTLLETPGSGDLTQ
ncbi:hypothetical protein [Lihuaxuella thermophila]|uniref:Uncharacterized protein n=1 Tax=Lihuaxuella thermophila TaxID=1173111 RepID=A0A1H8BQT1_9BACL|nr:hypothetical protein [Lihuaxuella thermophila]SEM85240.1 hypothetical protein SAMN05444955_102313 [Lihuaxuella thermophila]